MLNPQELHSTFVSRKPVSPLGAEEEEGREKRREISLQNAEAAVAKSSQVVPMLEML